MLNTLAHGEKTNEPPLLIAHGLFGSARNWNAVAKRLSAERRVIAVDMRNHGNSPWREENTYDAMAADLAAEIEALGGEVDLLGHSMGGKAAMMTALKHPDLVARLIVVDIAPKPYSHSQIHVVRAMESVDLNRVSRRSDADAQLKVHIPEAELRAFLLQSLVIQDQVAAWRFNLGVLGEDMPEIMGFPAISDQFTKPCLFLSGATSDYVNQQDRQLVLERFPNAEFSEIDGAGHWVHAEQPKEFVRIVEQFLQR